MKKIVFCLCLMVMVFSMFILSDKAFAANWVYVGRDEGSQPLVGNVYIDSATVVRNGDAVVFLALWVYDAPFQLTTSPSLCQKSSSKFEAKLTSPYMFRNLETYFYDSNGNEIYRDTTPEEWHQAGSVGDNLINTALRYVK
ncbi:MAG: hypothetical protein MUO24_06570 [Desulfobacterales bacterium]|nr:hypothetical protein [Desulfobacterales bacterium]